MGHEGTSDEHLIEAYRRGNKDAFNKIYCRYYGRIYNFIYRLRPHREDAEDLAEETFLKVLQNIESYDPTKAKFSTWLYRITYNHRINHLRRHSKGIVESLDDERRQALEHISSEAPILQEIVEVQEFSEPVHKCLSQLTEKHRVVLLLELDQEDFTLEEIACILGIPPGTARSRHHYALHNMKKYLKREGYQLVPRGSQLPPGAEIVMRFEDELLVCIMDGSHVEEQQ